MVAAMVHGLIRHMGEILLHNNVCDNISSVQCYDTKQLTRGEKRGTCSIGNLNYVNSKNSHLYNSK